MYLLLFVLIIGLGVWWLYKQQPWGKYWLEWAFVAAGAALIAEPFLNMDAQIIPSGGEFLSNIQYFHFWHWLQTCGWCAFWSPMGSMPILADPFPPLLHPLVALPVIALGVVNGAKFAILLAFLSAGTAQWWLGLQWRLRPLARVWGAYMLMASGYLAGRLALGGMHIIISLGTAAWVFPSVWWLWEHEGKKSYLPLAAALGMTILAERGYTITALFLSGGLLLATLYLVDAKKFAPKTWKKLSNALLGMLAISAVTWLPWVRTIGHTIKDIDTKFTASQTFGNLLVNFVVADPDFFRSPVVNKVPFPEITAFFIGWLPFLLAVTIVVLTLSGKKQQLPVLPWALWSIFILWVATAQPLRWLISWFPSPKLEEFLGGLRHIQWTAALAIPLILALAALEVDNLLAQTAEWKITLATHQVQLALPAAFFIAVIAWLPIRNAWRANRDWMSTTEYPQIQSELDFLAQAGLNWVEVPFGEHWWIEPAIARNLKITGTSSSITRWRWKDWTPPPPARFLTRDENAMVVPDDILVKLDEGLFGIIHQTNYAYILLEGEEQIPCEASGWGGSLTVRCNAQHPGDLQVMEKSWHGWWMRVDDGSWQRVDIQRDYLGGDVPAGKHTIRLQYIPEDALAGLLFFVIWLGWLLKTKTRQPAE